VKSVCDARVPARFVVALAMVLWGIVAIVQGPPLAFAQTTTLSADEIAAIQTAVENAIANVDPNLTGQARINAISQALTQVATSQISANGVAAITPIISAALSAGIPTAQVIAPVLPAATNAGIPADTAINAITVGAVNSGASGVQTTQTIIAVAQQMALTGNAVGSGLGQAASVLSQTNAGAANQVAVVVSNEGTTGTGQAFGATVVGGGGSQQLANIGLQNPNANFLTGATGTTTATAATGREATTGTTAVTATTVFTANANTASLTTSTISVTSGASQQISAVGTTITCTNPSCN
jgi:hypothetical protein